MKPLSIAFVLCGFAFGAAWAEDLAIAEGGQARADIVIPAQPSAIVRFAATELKAYLDRITGGDFRITHQPTAALTIRLGQSPEAAAAGLRPETLKRDGFFISAQGTDIFIVGQDNPAALLQRQGQDHFYAPFVAEPTPDPNRPANYFNLLFDEPQRGTLLGVYQFLEQFGVRWPAPGPEHECVPQCATLMVRQGVRKCEPFFVDRQMACLWDFTQFRYPLYTEPIFPDAKDYARNANDIYLWGLRLRLSGRSMVLGCHSEEVLGLKEAYGDHPERFALINGTRHFAYSCWTDPGVAEMWKKAADVYFSGGTPAEAGLPHLSAWRFPFFSPDDFMVDPADHDAGCDGRCRCARCNAFRESHPCADDSEIIWKVIVDVAESIQAKHPGKFISTLVYPPKKQLPKFVKIPSNVRVRICILGPQEVPTPNRLRPELDLVRTWSEALGGNKPPLWTYQVYTAFGRHLPGLPETYPHQLAEFLRIYRNDMAGMFFEQHALSHTYRNLDLYIAARLLWNPDLDVDDELTDYFVSYYGPAAAPAQELFRRFEGNWVKYWKRATPDQAPEPGASSGLGSPARELQQVAWSEIYPPEEMQAIEGMVAAVEKAAAGPVFSKRASLLRPWVFDVMKMERSEVMDNKEEIRHKIIAEAPVIQAAPVLDDWRQAPVYPLVPAVRMIPRLAAGGQFQALRGGDVLFLRAELKEPHLADSLTQKDRAPHDRNVFLDNDLEIFVYSLVSKDLWQIIVNDQGNWASQRIRDGGATWLPLEGFQVKVSSSADGWVAEAAMPLAQLGAGELRLNLTRNRQVRGQLCELSTWSPLAKVGNWHDPENYGTLVFGGGVAPAAGKGTEP